MDPPERSARQGGSGRSITPGLPGQLVRIGPSNLKALAASFTLTL